MVKIIVSKYQFIWLVNTLSNMMIWEWVKIEDLGDHRF